MGAPAALHVLSARGEVTCVEARGGRAALATGRLLRELRWEPGAGWAEVAVVPRAHRYAVTTLRLAGGGALLASGGTDGVVRLWARRLRPVRVLAAPAAPAVRALAWSGARLLAGHDDGALRVWSAGGALLATLHAHSGSLTATAAPALGALLLTACTDGVVKLHDMQAVLRECSVEGTAGPPPLSWEDSAHDLGVLCCAVRGDGGAAATGGRDALVRLWRVGGAQLERGPLLTGHAGAVTALAWARDTLASVAMDGTARLWDDSGACLLILPAHSRYACAVALDPRLRYVMTGSGDRTARTWPLVPVTLDDDLEPECSALAHFGLGDLEGIEPASEPEPEAVVGGDEPRCVWSDDAAHGGAVNCLAAHGDLLASACSDGGVRLLRWELLDEISVERELQVGGYPALAVCLGCGGRLLLAAGVEDQALVWDTVTGKPLQALAAWGIGRGEGGGARGASVSCHRPPLLLLAADDGTAPCWALGAQETEPIHVYESSGGEAAWCCAWARGGALAAVGDAGGELRLVAAPPDARLLLREPNAHDLGLQSCDFSTAAALGYDERHHLLATAGNDEFMQFWVIHYEQGASEADVVWKKRAVAHGGGVRVVRLAEGGALAASGGADRWARVWRVKDAACLAALPAPGAAPLSALAFTARGLALGADNGATAGWVLPAWLDSDTDDDEAGLGPRAWSETGAARWLREALPRLPEERVQRAALTGVRLMDDDPVDIEAALGLAGDEEKGDAEERERDRALLREELAWLRAPQPPPGALEDVAPHGLLCPLTHALLRLPARAADGFTYERAAAAEWLAAEGGISPVTGRRLRDQRLAPNRRLRETLRTLLTDHGYGPTQTQ